MLITANYICTICYIHIEILLCLQHRYRSSFYDRLSYLPLEEVTKRELLNHDHRQLSYGPHTAGFVKFKSLSPLQAKGIAGNGQTGEWHRVYGAKCSENAHLTSRNFWRGNFIKVKATFECSLDWTVKHVWKAENPYLWQECLKFKR